MLRDVQPESIAALVVIHQRKREITATKLTEALARMTSGNTHILKPSFKWLRKSLAAEAGIHINTLLARNPNGALLYQSVLSKFDQHKSRRTNSKDDTVQRQIGSLKTQLAEAVEERDKLRNSLREMEWKVIAESERAMEALRDVSALKMRIKELR